jgi:hypothetical protein
MPENTNKQQVGLPLPLPAKKAPEQIVEDKKTKAVKEYIAYVRKVSGIAGEMGLSMFATKNKGVDFTILGNGEGAVVMRPHGDTGLYIQGKPIGDKETMELIRGLLRKELEPENEKKKP